MIDADHIGKPLGLRDGTLRLLPYQKEWPDLYRQEATRIRQAIASQATVDIHHIGSTSVMGLAAKPILDIALVAKPEDEELVANALVSLGYTDRGERSGRLFILEDGKNVRTHNLHLYAPGDQLMNEQIAFRNALRRDPKAREQYVLLKMSLLDGARKDYAPGKTSFVVSLLGR
ncbi:MAG: GrpB family protein [Loktanella sp.]|nr:GrpB family protein [Loktanella sp.]